MYQLFYLFIKQKRSRVWKVDVLVLVQANIGLVKKEIKFWRTYLEIGYISIYKTPHIKYEFLKLKIKITSIKVFFIYLFLCPYHGREPYEKWGEGQIKTRDANV